MSSHEIEPGSVFGRYRKVVASAVGAVVVGVVSQDPVVAALAAASAFGVFVIPNVPDVRAIRRAIDGVSDFDQGRPEDPRV